MMVRLTLWRHFGCPNWRLQPLGASTYSVETVNYSRQPAATVKAILAADFCHSYSNPGKCEVVSGRLKKGSGRNTARLSRRTSAADPVWPVASDVIEELALGTPGGWQWLGEQMFDREIRRLRSVEYRLLKVGSKKGEGDQASAILRFG